MRACFGADHPEHLKLLCLLADAQLELEAAELQGRIGEQLLLLSQGLTACMLICRKSTSCLQASDASQLQGLAKARSSVVLNSQDCSTEGKERPQGLHLSTSHQLKHTRPQTPTPTLTPTHTHQSSSEAAVKDAVEAEWAKEILESNSSAVTLRQIITAAPPSPEYAHYYSSYLRRCVSQIGVALQFFSKRKKNTTAGRSRNAVVAAPLCNKKLDGLLAYMFACQAVFADTHEIDTHTRYSTYKIQHSTHAHTHTHTHTHTRLRTAVYAAPPQSMERHSRRAEVLHFALATMRGTSASGVPGEHR
eukprot:1133966-Pelagomonas_calceolata.AAC.3